MITSYHYNQRVENLFTIWLGTIVPASFSLAVLNAASNTLNQITDVRADRISKPYRPIPQGIVSPKEARVISFLLYVLSFSLSTHVHRVFSCFVLLIIIFTITYSLYPRVKDVLFVNQVWIAIPRGLLGIMASWSVFGTPFHPLPLTIGIIAMSYLIGGSITKDVIDSDADKNTGTQTLINTYGVTKSAFISLPFMFFPFTTIPLLIEYGILDSYLWSLTFLAIPGFLVFYVMIKKESKGRFMENTYAWTLMYITYLMFASSFSLLTILNSLNP
jgi:4-hydroxybenzoate polyprenyltransferase